MMALVIAPLSGLYALLKTVCPSICISALSFKVCLRKVKGLVNTKVINTVRQIKMQVWKASRFEVWSIHPPCTVLQINMLKEHVHWMCSCLWWTVNWTYLFPTNECKGFTAPGFKWKRVMFHSEGAKSQIQWRAILSSLLKDQSETDSSQDFMGLPMDGCFYLWIERWLLYICPHLCGDCFFDDCIPVLKCRDKSSMFHHHHQPHSCLCL